MQTIRSTLSSMDSLKLIFPFNAYNYIHPTTHTHIYIYKLGSTNLQCTYCSESWSLHQCCWLMKMGHIFPRVDIESTFPEFHASLLTISPSRLPDSTTLPYSLTTRSTCFRGSLPERSVQTTSTITILIFVT